VVSGFGTEYISVGFIADTIIRIIKMKISKLINELKSVKRAYGDVDVQIRKFELGKLMANNNIFVVPEDYEENGEKVTLCNLQTFSH
jgi:hypothetical protein